MGQLKKTKLKLKGVKMRNSKVVNGNKIAIVNPKVFESDNNSIILSFELQVPRNLFEIKILIEEGEISNVINQDSFADAYDYLDTFMRPFDIDKVIKFIDATSERIARKIILSQENKNV